MVVPVSVYVCGLCVCVCKWVCTHVGNEGYLNYGKKTSLIKKFVLQKGLSEEKGEDVVGASVKTDLVEIVLTPSK